MIADTTVAAAPPAAAPKVRIQSFEEILQQVRAGTVPMQLPVQPGSAVPRGPARSLYEWSGATPRGQPVWAQRGEAANACPTATEETLRNAREMAKRMEEEGLAAFRKTGQIPKGPPSPPIGAMLIEQKFVDFIIGPAGQSLAALNYAAGVYVHLDQTHKYSGYTIAHIYGPEDCTKRAKVALEFKISQWLPKGVTYAMAAPIGAVSPVGEGTPPLHPSQQNQNGASNLGAPGTLLTSTSSAPGSANVRPSPQQPAPPPTAAESAACGAGSAGGSCGAARPEAAKARSVEVLPPEALADPLVQSLAKWPSLAQSAARASAARSTGRQQVPQAPSAVTGGML